LSSDKLNLSFLPSSPFVVCVVGNTRFGNFYFFGTNQFPSVGQRASTTRQRTRRKRGTRRTRKTKGWTKYE
jgi:hypothetical protein